MAEIIAKYPENQTDFLLPVITKQADERRQYDNALHLVNYRLKELSIMLKLQRPMDGTGETDACRPTQTAGSAMAEAESQTYRDCEE